jgi:hypothetical protein
MLQALVRGKLQRNEQNKQMKAAVKLEAIVRARQTREDVAQQHKAATKVEAAKRGLDARKEHKKQEKAAMLIESKIRTKIVRTKKNLYEDEMEAYARSPSFTGKPKTVTLDEKPKPPANCCVQWWDAMCGWHTLLLFVRQPSDIDIDGRYLHNSKRLSDPQAMQVIYTVLSFDVLTVGLLYLYADTWQHALFPPAVLSGAATSSITTSESATDTVLHILIIAAASLACGLGTVYARILFRVTNYLVIKYRGPILPDDGTKKKVTCKTLCTKANWTNLLGWCIGLGTSLAFIALFALATLHIQLYNNETWVLAMFIDIGASLAFALFVLEPLAAATKATLAARARNKIAKAKKAAAAAEAAKEEGAPAGDDVAAPDDDKV